MADFNIFFATGLTYFQSKSMTLTTFIVKVGKDGSMNSWDSESSSVFGSIFSYENSLNKKRGRNWRKTIPNICRKVFLKLKVIGSNPRKDLFH